MLSKKRTGNLFCLAAAAAALAIAPAAAQTPAIGVALAGDVGFGTDAPDGGDALAERFIEIKEASGDVRAVFDYGTAAPSFGELMFQSGNANQWSFGSYQTNGGDNDFYIFNYPRSRVDLGIDGATGNLILGGTCSDSDGGGGGADGCDAVFSASYELPSIEQHAAAMWAKKHLPAVGPTPEGEHIQFSMQERHFAVLNELEKAHIYIEQLHDRVSRLEQENARLRDEDSLSAALQERLARLESAVLGVQ